MSAQAGDARPEKVRGILLERLVALNAKRSSEEAGDTVRWPRPDFQRRNGEQTGIEIDVEIDEAEDWDEDEENEGRFRTQTIQTRAWPTGLTEQIKAVADVMREAGRRHDIAGLAAHFTGRRRWRGRLRTLLDTLISLGRLRLTANGRWIDAGH